ncbi:hypothetical protein AGMMS50212_07190 [Spirochaetia bacterium]|nr:hypothetical protein AGMMS50212_07190 [Spirochaetia bacterium]
MGALKYLYAVWAAMLFYAISSFMVGAVGLSAYDQLNAEKTKQLENLKNLQTINKELLELKESLSFDSDTISVYARDLGFGTEDEHFIRIVGLNGIHQQQISPGELFRTTNPVFIDDKTLRIVALVIAGLIFLCTAIVDVLQFARNS